METLRIGGGAGQDNGEEHDEEDEGGEDGDARVRVKTEGGVGESK